MLTHARRMLFRFTLIAFLFSAVVPFFAVYELPEDHAQQAELASIFGDRILICTENGFEWVSLADLRQGEHQPHADSHLKCGLCYFTAKGGAHHQLSAVALSLDVPLNRALREHFPYAAPVLTPVFLQTVASRAPPVLV